MNRDDTPDLNETNAHRALWLSETAVDQSERAWLAWVATCERLLGHDVDGWYASDAFSQDDAYGAWEAGVTAAEYAAQVRENPGYQGGPVERLPFDLFQQTASGRDQGAWFFRDDRPRPHGPFADKRAAHALALTMCGSLPARGE
jgi:hypothetical protein